MRPFGDPSQLSRENLWTLLCAVYEGICYFREVNERERTILIEAWERGVREKIYKVIPPRKKREDEGEYRGRHLDPETGRKKRGGWVRSPPEVPTGWDKEN